MSDILNTTSVMHEDGTYKPVSEIIAEDDFVCFGSPDTDIQLQVTPLVMVVMEVVNSVEQSLFSSASKEVLGKRIEKLLIYLSEESEMEEMTCSEAEEEGCKYCCNSI